MVKYLKSVNEDFWKGKKVFLTGHTGFKGSWMAAWLHQLDAEVKGFSLKPETSPNLFEVLNIDSIIKSEFGDIRDLELLKNSINSFSPDIIFHMAAQPLVRESYENPIETYDINVLGTLKVLKAAHSCQSTKAIIIITTDKCYDNKEWHWPYREIDPLGGHDPYSSSKACCELLVNSYRKSYLSEDCHPYLASARAGNVIGGGDWSKDRLVPDILRSIVNKEILKIRYPQSVRPWQHVLEPLSGYLKLAEKLFLEGCLFAEPWNFGPYDKDCESVGNVHKMLSVIWGHEQKLMIDKEANPHEANLLKLDCSKSIKLLDWQPKWDLQKALEMTVDWHKSWLLNEDMMIKTTNQIREYNE